MAGVGGFVVLVILSLINTQKGVGATVDVPYSGGQEALTVTAVWYASSSRTPPGDKLVVVDLTIRNETSAPIEADPAAQMTLVDSAGTTLAPSTVPLGAGCAVFAPQLAIAPGDSRSGCEVFAVPGIFNAGRVQFAPLPGVGGSTAIWVVPKPVIHLR
jgi:hypothetical protein